MSIINYTWEEVEKDNELFLINFLIDVEYQKGSPDVWSLSNGDPGYQGTAGEYTVNNITCLLIVGENKEWIPNREECEYWSERFMEEIAYSEDFYALVEEAENDN